MYLGIDLGTSSMKCLLLGEEQEILLSVNSEDIPLSTPQNGWSEQDPSFWIKALDQCIKQIVLKFDLSQIKAVSFSGHMHGATCIDKNHKVIRPCILWNDTRSFRQCSQIMADETVMDIAGNIAMPGFTSPKILWMKEHESENFNSIAKVLLGTYWLDVKNRTWSNKLLDIGSMDISQMPKTCEGTDQTGVIKKEIAEKYGFNNSCKVFGGAGDNAAAAVGLGLYQEGNASLSLGTSGVIFGSTKNFLKNYDDAIHSFCHCLPETWHLMSVMLSCTSNVNWFINNFNSSIDEINKELNSVLNNFSDVSRYPYYLPYLTGERTPINDPHVRASFHEMGIDTNRNTLIYSLIEGISFGLYDNYSSLVKTGIKLDNIFVIGGGSKNDSWIQILASLMERDLSITDASDTMAAFGAARIAFLGYNNLKPSEALSLPKVKKIIGKNEIQTGILKDRFLKWKSFYLGKNV